MLKKLVILILVFSCSKNIFAGKEGLGLLQQVCSTINTSIINTLSDIQKITLDEVTSIPTKCFEKSLENVCKIASLASSNTNCLKNNTKLLRQCGRNAVVANLLGHGIQNFDAITNVFKSSTCED